MMRRRTASRPPGNAGFTIPEVMIALGIFSIGILAVYSMQMTSIKGNATARRVTDSATIASAKAEELALIAFDDDRLAAGEHAPAVTEDGIDNDMDGLIDEPGETANATLSWTVADDCLGDALQGHKCIEVRVTSNLGGGQQRDVRLNFIRGNML
jgi:type IV pilus assembly protein PilV